MPTSWIKRIERRAWSCGMHSDGLLVISAAILVGWSQQRDQTDGRALFARLRSELHADHDGDALIAVRDWLSDPGLSSRDWEFVSDSLRFLQQEESGPIDWNAEVAFCLHPERSRASPEFSLPLSLAQSIVRMQQFTVSGSIGCFFSSSASVAWVLADQHDVTLYADRQMATLMALFARPAKNKLSVRYVDPPNMSLLSASGAEEGWPSLLSENFDHIFSIPPFGLRLPKKGTFEAYQIERLAPRARRSFTTLILDGLLFRETKAEAELRKEWVTRYHATVMSLPSGMFWPVSTLSTSLLRLEPGASVSVRMIDGRSMEKSSSGRVQESLIVQHLEGFRPFEAGDTDRAVDVPIEQLVANGYSLLPERYLKSKRLRALENALRATPSVLLADLADIERGKTPVPLRETNAVPAITALEITPSDLIDGTVRPPGKQQAFALSEKPRVEGVTVRSGDILVSIKGVIGIVGIVTETGAEDEPWIISQSLAIIRLKPNPHISSPSVLNAMLTAPWVREKLESLSGATTVRALPISAVRGLSLPIPTMQDISQAESRLAEIADIREQIERRQRDLATRRARLWAELWRMSPKSGEN